ATGGILPQADTERPGPGANRPTTAAPPEQSAAGGHVPDSQGGDPMIAHWQHARRKSALALFTRRPLRGLPHHGRPFHASSRLEDRALPSTLLVSNPGDHGPGTLRDAIVQSQLNPGSIINFTFAGTITLASALPALSHDVTIGGPGHSAVTIQRDSTA